VHPHANAGTFAGTAVTRMLRIKAATAFARRIRSSSSHQTEKGLAWRQALFALQI
jgi:hypothetical protein